MYWLLLAILRIVCHSLFLLSVVSGSVSILFYHVMVGGHLVFGGVVGSVVDGGVSCCWFVVYVDLYCGGVSDNCQVEKINSVVVLVCGCEFQGGVYAVNVVLDGFWGYFLSVIYYQYVVDISCVKNYVACVYDLF